MNLKAMIFAVGLSATALGAAPASAMPIGPQPEMSGVEQVWGGCGPYGHRGPWGGCRRGGQWGGRPFYGPRPYYRPYRPYRRW